MEDTAVTPRPWPDYAKPAPEQLAEWLGVCTPTERLNLAQRALEAQDEAIRCFEQNHVGRLEHFEKQQREGQRRIVLHPSRRSGEPTVGDSRIPVDMVAGVHWQHGLAEAETQWEPQVTRDGVLAACWYVARYGTRTWRKRWAGWLEVADEMLWHSGSWDTCPAPPSLADSDESQEVLP